MERLKQKATGTNNKYLSHIMAITRYDSHLIRIQITLRKSQKRIEEMQKAIVGQENYPIEIVIVMISKVGENYTRSQQYIGQGNSCHRYVKSTGYMITSRKNRREESLWLDRSTSDEYRVFDTEMGRKGSSC